MESSDKSPSEQQSPFWESAQVSETQSVSLPQQQSTQFSGTVNDPAQYIVTSGYDMSGKKEGMNWGQFAKGFFTPYATMMLLTIFSGVEFTDFFLLLMLIIGIVAIVISFARGNKSYGYGLLISVSIPVLWIVFIYGFLILLMLGVS